MSRYSRYLPLGALLIAVSATWAFQARTPTPEQLAIREASEQDRQKMLDQLGIKSLRPPVDARAKTGPNIANYDESINGRAGNCSMLNIPCPRHFPCSIIMAPIIAGTPVV